MYKLCLRECPRFEWMSKTSFTEPEPSTTCSAHVFDGICHHKILYSTVAISSLVCKHLIITTCGLTFTPSIQIFQTIVDENANWDFHSDQAPVGPHFVASAAESLLCEMTGGCSTIYHQKKPFKPGTLGGCVEWWVWISQKKLENLQNFWNSLSLLPAQAFITPNHHWKYEKNVHP